MVFLSRMKVLSLPNIELAILAALDDINTGYDSYHRLPTSGEGCRILAACQIAEKCPVGLGFGGALIALGM